LAGSRRFVGLCGFVGLGVAGSAGFPLPPMAAFLRATALVSASAVLGPKRPSALSS
jgi:hypothetical protein